MIGYAKCFDTNKRMSLKAIDMQLLKKYTKKWKRIWRLINIELDSEPFYSDSDKSRQR